MPDILLDLPIQAPALPVFGVLCAAEGLDTGGTRQAEGRPGVGNRYRFFFGPEYDWAGVMRRYQPSTEVEWEMTEADEDWTGTLVGFRLTPAEKGTHLEFHHSGWPLTNAHFRTSCYCWAMYLRLLKRYVEQGEVVPYDRRLAV